MSIIILATISTTQENN
ncbi:protein YtgA [Escherichia coli]